MLLGISLPATALAHRQFAGFAKWPNPNPPRFNPPAHCHDNPIFHHPAIPDPVSDHGLHMAASRVSVALSMGIFVSFLPHLHRPQSMTFTQITTAAAKKGIAISRLADMAGVARSTVSRAKKGEFEIKPVTLAKLAQALKGVK